MLPVIALSLIASATTAAASNCPDGYALNTATIPQGQKLKWESCRDEERPKLECSSLQVPLDYSDPSRGTLRIPVVRIPAASEKSCGKSVFMNPGGPGESGIQFVANSLKEDGSSKMVDQSGGEYNIVSFDPRGVGVTIPFECPTLDLSSNITKRSTVTPSSFDDPEFVSQKYMQLTQQAALCAKDEWRNLSEVVGTAYVARDVDALFQAMDEDGLIRYWGLSYGTLLGSTIAAMYPDKIDRMVLDGNINPTEYYHGINEESVAEVDDALQHFFDQCAEIGPDHCSFAATGDSAQDLQDNFYIILETIRDAGENETVEAIESTVFTALKTPQTCSQAEQTLAQVWEKLTSESNLTTRALAGALEKNPKLGTEEHTPLALYAITCGDWENIPATLQDWQEWIKAYRATSDFGSGVDLITITLQCSTWQTRAKERFGGSFTNIKTRTPILFVNTPYDPVTPMLSAINASSGFVGSDVLHHEGAGHCSPSTPSKCTIDKVRSYFVTGKIPDVSKPCFPDNNQFNATDASDAKQKRDDKDDEQEEEKEEAFKYPPAILQPYGDIPSKATESVAPPPATCTPAEQVTPGSPVPTAGVPDSGRAHNGKLSKAQLEEGLKKFKASCEGHSEDSWMYKAICDSLE